MADGSKGGVEACVAVSARWPKRRHLIVCAMIMLAVIGAGVAYFRPVPVEVLSKGCTGQLALIDRAITAWATEKGKGTLDIPTEAEVRKYLDASATLKCPEGGAYQLGTLALATACSVHGHAVVPVPVYKPPLKERFRRIMERIPLIGGDFSRIGTRHGPYCIANLKQLDGAVQQWALESRKKGDAVPVISEVVEYLKGSQLPICFQGGKYYLGKVKDAPCCTMAGHSI